MLHYIRCNIISIRFISLRLNPFDSIRFNSIQFATGVHAANRAAPRDWPVQRARLLLLHFGNGIELDRNKFN